MPRPHRSRPFRPARFLPESRAGYGILAFFLMGFCVIAGDTLVVASHRSGSTIQSMAGTALMLGGPLLAIALMILGHRSIKRDSIPPGHCQSCGYNLTGNVSGRCPECGTLINKVRRIES